jgi:MFS family permease
VLILLQEWSSLWKSGRVVAAVSILATGAILWPWVAAIGILLVSFFMPVRGWALPFYCSLIVPLSVAALLVLPRVNPPLSKIRSL